VVNFWRRGGNASAKREEAEDPMAKKAKVNSRYKVNMSVQAYDLAKAGSAMTIKVHERGKLLGTIEIGQGSFRWMPAHGKLGLRRIPWKKLYHALNEYY
jgi:hypothetical protein